MEDARSMLKQIRDTEKSVQPSRDNKKKITEEIARLKSKEPENTRLVTLEQELVRAEAENLVAEAQLYNTVSPWSSLHLGRSTIEYRRSQLTLRMAVKTRQKLKQAYDAEFLATIERAEKQIILARHGRRLINLLDDSPIVPGEQPPPYLHGAQARQVLNDAEDDLREWQLDPNDLFGAPGSENFPMRAHSPASVSPSADRKTPARKHTATTDDSEAVENTHAAKPRGEHPSVQEGGGPGGVVVEARDWVDENRTRSNNTEASLSQSLQQLEESTVLTGSPVSSVEGWRVHANLFSPKQRRVAY